MIILFDLTSSSAAVYSTELNFFTKNSILKFDMLEQEKHSKEIFKIKEKEVLTSIL